MSHPSFPTPSSLPRAGSHLRVDGLSFSYGAHRVLTDVSFVVPAGDRIGLIGENGSGKSTLLRIVAGLLSPGAGTVSVQAGPGGHPVIGLLHQEVPFDPGDAVAAALEAAVAPARRAVAAIGRLGEALARTPDDPHVSQEYATALETAERLDAWQVDTRIDTCLDGLGLGAIDRDRATGTLSGGQRARLALAWLLLSSPDVLLLDEPTNHLDDAAVDYLVGVLAAWRGPVLLASHDRAFLDDAVTSLVDLDPSAVPHSVSGPLVREGVGTGIGVTRFTGPYSDYLAARVDARQRWQRQYRDERAELRRLRAQLRDQQTVGHAKARARTEIRMAKKFFADRNAAVVSRRVRDARGRLEDLEERQIRKPPAELRFRGLTAAEVPTPSEATGPAFVGVDVAVAGRLAARTFTIGRGERWLVTGPNGSGKSTLLHVLAGRLEPTSGRVTRSCRDRILLLSQETELPDPHRRGPGRTAARAYADLVGEDLAQSSPLTTFGLIAARDQNRPVGELSVGQQRRLALAVLLARPPQILLLDEPTNHFSLDLVTALEDSFDDYPGTLVVASHDRWLRRRWGGEELVL